MEFVPFTTEQLSFLAKQDSCLAPIFGGVFAADELPGLPEKWKKRAYIVNTDEISKPGSSQCRKRNRDEFTQKQRGRHARHYGQIKTLQTHP